MPHGGKRNNAGRKAKADELALIERLSPLEDIAIEKLSAGLRSGEFAYVKLYMEYRYGKPKESIAVKGKTDHVHRIIVEDIDGSEI